MSERAVGGFDRMAASEYIDIQGKVCVVTGASSGIGEEAACRLARAGASVVILGRDRKRGERVRAHIARVAGGEPPDLQLVDFSSLRQVRALADSLASRYGTIHALVNNAGVYRARPEMSQEGFERTLAVNYLAHFLLTNLLLAALRAGRARVINVSSGAHRMAKLKRKPLEQIIRSVGDYDGKQAYADSKLANILFSFELARRERALTAIALHPGVLATRIWNRNADLLSLAARLGKPFMERPAKGGERIVRLVTGVQFASATGTYHNRDQQAEAAADAYDLELATRLWTLSEELTGLR